MRVSLVLDAATMPGCDAGGRRAFECVGSCQCPIADDVVTSACALNMCMHACMVLVRARRLVVHLLCI